MQQLIPWLSADNYDFPDPTHCTSEGLLAVGGDLSSGRVLAAYKKGIFPWYAKDSPILWWSLNPRCVLYPHELHIPKSLHKVLNANSFTISYDHCFSEVIEACATTARSKNPAEHEGTWITNEIKKAYTQLHQEGFAHSIEVWQEKKLVGGVYGMCLGKVFFGESMFYHVPNASKIALVHLVQQLQQWQFHFIDCQQVTDNLLRFGAKSIPRETFLAALQKGTNCTTSPPDFPALWTQYSPSKP